MTRTTVVGGGLADLSAAQTVLERGGSVPLLDKKLSLGGNSVTAGSSTNGPGTKVLGTLGDREYYANTAASAGPRLARPGLVTTLTANSESTIAWLTDAFNVDLSFASRLEEHTIPRTQRDTSGRSPLRL
ncbi:hypothetical protein C8R45DRAFT_1109573 [Mycena sanguinolenta]|nr:hypothetical protein C8R45DRAFT_1109573 [Mycena sanguinolenta]